MDLENIINSVLNNNKRSQESLIETRHTIGKLRAVAIELKEKNNTLRNRYSCLEERHRNETDNYIERIDNISREAIENRNNIQAINNQIQNSRDQLTQVNNCLENCNETFIRKVMEKINQELENEFNFDNLRTELDTASRNFIQTDNEIISEYNRVLNETNKLKMIGIRNSPFESIDLLKNNLNEQNHILNNKRDKLKLLNENLIRDQQDSVLNKRNSHENKKQIINSFNDLLVNKSNEQLKDIASSDISHDITGFELLQRNFLEKIEKFRFKIENIFNIDLTNNNANKYLEIAFLILFAFLIFFIDCLIAKK